MLNPETKIITISVLGREFKIQCPENEINELHKAAAYLNNKMQKVHRGNKSTTIEHIAITAALNIAHELITEKPHSQLIPSDPTELTQRLFDLKHKVNKALGVVDNSPG